MASLGFEASSCYSFLCAVYTSPYTFISHKVDILRIFASPSQENIGKNFSSFRISNITNDNIKINVKYVSVICFKFTCLFKTNLYSDVKGITIAWSTTRAVICPARFYVKREKTFSSFTRSRIVRQGNVGMSKHFSVRRMGMMFTYLKFSLHIKYASFRYKFEFRILLFFI